MVKLPIKCPTCGEENYHYASCQKLHCAKERVGDEEQQIADVLAQLRSGGIENKIRAITLARRLSIIHT